MSNSVPFSYIPSDVITEIGLYLRLEDIVLLQLVISVALIFSSFFSSQTAIGAYEVQRGIP